MIFLALLALLPVAVVLWFVYFKDKRKEPLRTLAFTFMWGTLTVIPVVIIELLFDTSNPFVENFLVVAPTEEFFKFLVVMLYVWKHKDFDDSFDAIVYCVTASLGFAAIENLFYVLDNGFGVGIARAVTSIPGHAEFAVFMGYFLCRAKTHFYHQRSSLMKKNLAYALGSAILIHGCYDYFLSMEWHWLFIVSIIVLDIAAIYLINKASKEDKPMIIDDLK